MSVSADGNRCGMYRDSSDDVIPSGGVHNRVSDECIYRNIHRLSGKYGSITDLTVKASENRLNDDEKQALTSMLTLESMLAPLPDGELESIMEPLSEASAENWM